MLVILILYNTSHIHWQSLIEDSRDHGLRPFSIYQGQWNAAKRDFERDIIPMCHAEGMGICPWGALGSGAFKTTAQRQQIAKSNQNPGRQAHMRVVDIEVSKVLETIAAHHQVPMTSVALAYVMQKAPYVYPIVGGRTVEHLQENIAALTLRLSRMDIQDIERVYEFDMGFPNTYIFQGADKEAHPRNSTFLNMAATFDFPDSPQPVMPKASHNIWLEASAIQEELHS